MGAEVSIAIIGAGSATFSAGIVRDLAVVGGLEGSRIVLMDVDEQRLAMIGLLARRINEELNAGLVVETTASRGDALRGADFVINTAQVGGHGWAEEQRAIAERHGYYRGARLQGLGQSLFFLEVARDMERLCPDAWLIQSANPLPEGCTLIARETAIRCIGLCHGHYGYLGIARTIGLEPEQVTAQVHGLNHCVWMTDFRYRGRDAYPLLEKWIETQAERYWAENHDRHFADLDLSRAAVHQYRIFGLMPIGDTPRFAGWWYCTDLATRQHWYTADGGFDSELGWAKYLRRIDEKVQRIARVARDADTPVTQTFEPRLSREQIVPIIQAIACDVRAVYQVNVPNRGPVLSHFPQDLVVELPAIVDGAGVHPTAVPDLPPKIVFGALVPRWQRAELAVHALRTGDLDAVRQLLLCHPFSRSLAQVDALIRDWLEAPANGAMRRLFGAP